MSLRDFTSTLSAKLKGKQYHNNLLGASLEELVRQATAKNLVFPDEELNQQVVFTINSEVGTVREPRDVCIILKKRLAMDNPQKQMLAVLLVQKVLQECTAVGPHTPELLQDVARVYAKTARGDPTAVINAKNAAKELLRRYGTAGQDAFRAVSRLPAGAGRPAAAVNTMYVQPEAVPGQPAVPPVVTAETRAAERASLMDEVQRMVDHARGHTELLNDMLVNSSGTTDDFERAMMRELVQDVADMRKMFTSYLESMGSLEGPDVEQLMCSALEAVDQLDNALTLVKDVEAEVKANPPSAPRPAVAPPPPAAAAAAPKEANLIDLDDLGVALPPVATAAPAAPAAKDPFAAAGTSSSAPAAAAADPFGSASDPFGSDAPQWTASPTHAGAAAPSAVPAAPAAAVAAAAVPASGTMSPTAAAAAAVPQGMPQQQQQQQMGYGMPGQPMPGQYPFQPNMMMQQQVGYGMPGYMPQQTGGYMPQTTGGYMPQQTGGYMPQTTGGYMPQTTGGYMPQTTGGYMPQTTGGYPGMMVGSPPRSFVGSPPNQYMMQPRPMMQQPPQQAAYGSPGPSNPFAAPAPAYKPEDAMAALNPFASKPAAAPQPGVPMAAAQNTAAVEADWNMFFADRAGGAGQAGAKQ